MEAGEVHRSLLQQESAQGFRGTKGGVHFLVNVSFLVGDDKAAVLAEWEGELSQGGQGPQGAGHDDIKGVTEGWIMSQGFGAAGKDLEVRQAQSAGQVLEEGGLLSNGFNEDDGETGEGDPKGDTGETGPGADVYQASAVLQRRGQDQAGGEGVQEVT